MNDRIKSTAQRIVTACRRRDFSALEVLRRTIVPCEQGEVDAEVRRIEAEYAAAAPPAYYR